GSGLIRLKPLAQNDARLAFCLLLAPAAQQARSTLPDQEGNRSNANTDNQNLRQHGNNSRATSWFHRLGLRKKSAEPAQEPFEQALERAAFGSFLDVLRPPQDFGELTFIRILVG